MVDLADKAIFLLGALELVVKAAIAGVNNYLVKPFTADRRSSRSEGNSRERRQLRDRLKLEFEALGDALTRYAAAANKSSEGVTGLAALKRNVISGITVADLKDRLLSRL